MLSWDERDVAYEELRAQGWCPDHAQDRVDYDAHPEPDHVANCRSCQESD